MGQMIEPGFKTLGWKVFHIRGSEPQHVMSFHPEVIEWCEQHIKGRWAHRLPGPMIYHTFFIEDHKDAVLFRLTWTPKKVSFK